MEETLEIIRASLASFFGAFAAALPRLISAIILLIIGWIIAKIIKWGIAKVLRIVKFNSITDKIGINEYLMKGGISSTSSRLIANLVYWIIMLVVWTAFFNTLGLEVVSDLLNKVVLYMPNIIVACLLIVVGMYLGEFVSGVVIATLKTRDIENAEFFGRIANAIILFFVMAMVLHQLGIGEEIIETIVAIFFGAVGLALALAFGLGGRDWAAGILEKYGKNRGEG